MDGKRVKQAINASHIHYLQQSAIDRLLGILDGKLDIVMQIIGDNPSEQRLTYLATIPPNEAKKLAESI